MEIQQTPCPGIGSARGYSHGRFRDAPQSLEHAERAAQLSPNVAPILNTLGVAQYRAGELSDAVNALDKAERLSPGKYFGHNAFFLAMAHWRLDEKEEASTWYDQAVEWMEMNGSTDEELKDFRAEAAELLGL